MRTICSPSPVCTEQEEKGGPACRGAAERNDKAHPHSDARWTWEGWRLGKGCGDASPGDLYRERDGCTPIIEEGLQSKGRRAG